MRALMTASEAAERLNVSLSTIRYWSRSGVRKEMGFDKVIIQVSDRTRRYDPVELDAFIETRRGKRQ